MWHVFQLSIVLAVMFSNVRYDWAHGTSNLAVAVVAVFAAWIATAMLSAAMDLARRLKQLLSIGNKRVQ
ncbi:MAG: hypothetical protein HXY30_04705 [Pseudorhodoplanes sp.]|nr:hypothetical protein [Pseudorhodoplanes sp.]